MEARLEDNIEGDVELLYTVGLVGLVGGLVVLVLRCVGAADDIRGEGEVE